MPTAVKEEAFEITASTAVGTSGTVRTLENDLAAISGDKSLQIVWEYPVPVGYAIVFTGDDILSAYLDDDTNGSAEHSATTCRVDVVIMDSSRQNVRSVMNPTFYGAIKEFAEHNKLKHMDIAAGDQIIANEGERICIRVAPPSAKPTLDASDSYFRLTCKRVRHTLFG